ncbi:MAG: 3',5'-cyclic-AMP phosphodiesterase [Succinivibrionaceae bacterium]|nr:3',5'-cyclic-AMP phosphodiesterase [Succinivibrionaceae bacterium]
MAPAHPGEIHILQLTDSHLFASRDARLLGIATADSLGRVIEAVLAEGRHLDFVIMTGDVSQDYSLESYEIFAELIRGLPCPVFFLPGNHDDGPLMYRIFPRITSQVHVAKCLLCEDWVFCFLNSEVYGVAHGWLQRDEIEFMNARLREHQDRRAVICLHHYPLLVDSAWLDTQTLHNQNEFLSAVSQREQVKMILCGHVHQEQDRQAGGIRCLATPSTSIQFAPLSHDFGLDSKGPGWRYLTLYRDGGVSTEVHRLPPDLFVPDYGVRGY